MLLARRKPTLDHWPTLDTRKWERREELGADHVFIIEILGTIVQNLASTPGQAELFLQIT